MRTAAKNARSKVHTIKCGTELNLMLLQISSRLEIKLVSTSCILLVFLWEELWQILLSLILTTTKFSTTLKLSLLDLQELEIENGPIISMLWQTVNLEDISLKEIQLQLCHSASQFSAVTDTLELKLFAERNKESVPKRKKPMTEILLEKW